VYNFEVAGLHDYFVSATATDSLVLSHNMCNKGGGASNSGRRTWQEAGISASDARRIQNAANSKGIDITVVGSRAKGTPNPGDWDYIVTGSSRQRSRAKNSVPRGHRGGEQSASGRETGIDWWQDSNPNAQGFMPLDPARPHVVFEGSR